MGVHYYKAISPNDTHCILLYYEEYTKSDCSKSVYTQMHLLAKAVVLSIKKYDSSLLSKPLDATGFIIEESL